MKYTVDIHNRGTKTSIPAEEGSNLLELLRNNGAVLDTPCGGKGTCGKCAVRVTGMTASPSGQEKKLLGDSKLEKGYRLACSNGIASDLQVYIEDSITEASIITGGKTRDISLDPIVSKQYIELPAPTLENQMADLERILNASDLRLEADNLSSDKLLLLQHMAGVIKNSAYKVTLIHKNGSLIAVEPGDSTGRIYGTAFDIGTTTVAAYLYNLATGERKAVSSALNPQRKYGADVITRINYTMQSAENRTELQRQIVSCMNELTERLAESADISCGDIYASVCTGNTTMQHLLLGLDAAGIAVAPFIPVTTSLQVFRAKEIGLKMNEKGIVTVFPCVSAYVGGDTVAAILSSGIYQEDGISLLVDVGTNGEIVLGGSNYLLACSTAAGPAFEGANIRNGVGGIEGAIDSIGPGPDFQYSTIGNTMPVGICGSGIIDVIAHMLEAGLIDETGRLADEDEVDQLGDEYKDKVVTIDGVRAFILVGGRNESSEQIAVTQRDIREIQNAKAAIAAGIDTLIHKAGITYDQVKGIYLAGGFGSSIHIDSAVKIGLLPKALEKRVEAIGNASGAGAAEGLLSRKMLTLSEEIGRKVQYIELSASAYFTEKYVDNMLF